LASMIAVATLVIGNCVLLFFGGRADARA